MGTSKVKYYNGRLQGNIPDENCEKLEFIRDAYDKDMGITQLSDMIYNLSDEDVDLLIDHKSSVKDKSLIEKGTLRPYQTVGAAFMYYAQSALLGDSVGLGKTVQVSALINIMEASLGRRPRVLVFVEKKPCMQVRRELIKFTGEFFEHTWGTRESMQEFIDTYPMQYPNLITTHSSIKSNLFQSWLLAGVDELDEYPYDLIVVDESSILGNSSTEVYKTAKKLFKGAPRLVMLNATPFEAKLDTFYHQLNLLDNTYLPTKKMFDDTYKVMSYNGFYSEFKGEYKNAEEFKKLVEFRYLPRTRRDLGATFDNCTAEIVTVPLSSAQKKLIRSTTLHKMVFDCPWTIDPSVEHCPKIDSLIELLERPALKDQQVLVYVHYKEAQAQLAQAMIDSGYDVEILNGSTPSAEAEDTISRFKSGELRYLITNIQKSLNFNSVDHCVFYSFHPNPNKMVQFEGRITRSFNIENKHVYVLLTEGKETETFTSTIRDRAEASKNFAGNDFSMILELLRKQLD